MEEYNCGVDEANESLLEGYRAELRDWRKKRAAVRQMQLRLSDAYIERIGETIRRRNEELSTLHEVWKAEKLDAKDIGRLLADFEAQTDLEVEELVLELNNEMAREASAKCRRTEAKAGPSTSQAV